VSWVALVVRAVLVVRAAQVAQVAPGEQEVPAELGTASWGAAVQCLAFRRRALSRRPRF
jgi:hypothetical protein